MALFLLAGCHIERIVLEEPVRDRLIEVKSEDHVAVRLDENLSTGYRWRAKCADPLVNVTVEHEEEDDDETCGTPGLATVHIRVRRGFIGPATVTLRCERVWSDECSRTVKLQLYCRPTDVAAWK